MKKKIVVVLALLLIAAVVAAVMTPNYSRAPRPQAKKKSCHANMKTIEGAVELYRMEKLKAGEIVAIDTKMLKDAGYLKAVPRCPVMITERDYKIKMGKTDDETEVSCVVHGDMSKQYGEHKYMGIEETLTLHYKISEFLYNGGYIAIIIILFVILAFAALSS